MPCDQCGGEGKIFRTQWHAIMADRLPAFGDTYSVRCESCKAETETFNAEGPAIEAWEKGLVKHWKRGFG